ncbi:3 beta-hydroxysteroid dehydrogenase/Delta 5--_4-isomerase-like [Ascaphus truei]|uniref:3 beta-hydroxysteroid dehydrogenase/Delta 5-->4-isomerase-like n=1 Tax=Ascaphus truei TaxID=8439 RepID=UPI003F591E80
MAQNLVYLVTGGCGYIGERIVALLVKEEYVKEVRVVDIVETELIQHFSTDLMLYVDIQGNIQIDIYRKPNARNSYLRADSNHPNFLKKGILKGQFIRLKRLCSTDEAFETQSMDLISRFRARGYQESHIKDAFDSVKLLDRRDFQLKRKEYSKQKLSCNEVITPLFITQQSKQSDQIRSIIYKHWNTLKLDSDLKIILDTSTSVILIKADITEYKHTLILSDAAHSTFCGYSTAIISLNKSSPEKPIMANAVQTYCDKQMLPMSQGNKLVTCAIRPSNVYGGKCKSLIESYFSAKFQKGIINYIEPENSDHNYTYVGNVAWMHVLAARNLQLKPDLLGGQVYYAYDDTPMRQRYKLIKELYSEIDLSVQLGTRIPYWKMWLIVQIHSIIRFLVRPFWNLKPFLTLPILKLVVSTFSYETDKAFRHFAYQPLYSWLESKYRTCKWLQLAKLNLKGPRKT